ncbi:MAG: hypothetical protein KAI74_04935, partial [Kiritimatiellae bacterium]|nr:hypothetical protein [Kiritimatiellia bacterium]
SNSIVFEQNQQTYTLPLGYDECRNAIVNYFPGDKEAVNKYFDAVKRICDNTASMNLRNLTVSRESCPEDYITVADFLDEITDNTQLKAVLSVYGLCYGSPSKEMTFAGHSRVCYGLYNGIARVKDGGDAFVRSLKAELEKYGVEILTNRFIESCEDIEDKRVGSFLLNSGERISTDKCIFTIHPAEILKTLPQDELRKGFCERVNGYQPSIGFFTLYATIDDMGPVDSSLVALCCTDNIDGAYDPSSQDARPLIFVTGNEDIKGKEHNVLHVFEVALVEDTQEWENSKRGSRPAAYIDYKERRVASIIKRIENVNPAYKGKINVVASASMLTFKDYLHSPYGCAYGIRQKVSQFNLFGKLPLRNIYAAGQSAVLPGVAGAMMSSFIIARGLIGKDLYNEFIQNQLG